jgi:hypothetical protein
VHADASGTCDKTMIDFRIETAPTDGTRAAN